jgi:hypothetical protein
VNYGTVRHCLGYRFRQACLAITVARAAVTAAAVQRKWSGPIPFTWLNFEISLGTREPGGRFSATMRVRKLTQFVAE